MGGKWAARCRYASARRLSSRYAATDGPSDRSEPADRIEATRERCRAARSEVFTTLAAVEVSCRELVEDARELRRWALKLEKVCEQPYPFDRPNGQGQRHAGERCDRAIKGLSGAKEEFLADCHRMFDGTPRRPRWPWWPRRVHKTNRNQDPDTDDPMLTAAGGGPD